MTSVLRGLTRGGLWLAKMGVSIGLALALAGCPATSPATDSTSGREGHEHEVFCMGSRAKCDGTAAAFCESRYGSPKFVLVRRVPERGALVISCTAE